LIATRIDETQAQYRLLDTRGIALEKLEERAEVDVVLRRMQKYVLATSRRLISLG